MVFIFRAPLTKIQAKQIKQRHMNSDGDILKTGVRWIIHWALPNDLTAPLSRRGYQQEGAYIALCSQWGWCSLSFILFMRWLNLGEESGHEKVGEVLSDLLGQWVMAQMVPDTNLWNFGQSSSSSFPTGAEDLWSQEPPHSPPQEHLHSQDSDMAMVRQTHRAPFYSIGRF